MWAISPFLPLVPLPPPSPPHTTHFQADPVLPSSSPIFCQLRLIHMPKLSFQKVGEKKMFLDDNRYKKVGVHHYYTCFIRNVKKVLKLEIKEHRQQYES
jgi:hypothetical protein